jgi:hypothetical protein
MTNPDGKTPPRPRRRPAGRRCARWRERGRGLWSHPRTPPTSTSRTAGPTAAPAESSEAPSTTAPEHEPREGRDRTGRGPRGVSARGPAACRAPRAHHGAACASWPARATRNGVITRTTWDREQCRRTCPRATGWPSGSPAGCRTGSRARPRCSSTARRSPSSGRCPPTAPAPRPASSGRQAASRASASRRATSACGSPARPSGASGARSPGVRRRAGRGRSSRTWRCRS